MNVLRSFAAIAAVAFVTAGPAHAQLDSTRVTGSAGQMTSLAMFDSSYRSVFFGLNRSVNTYAWTINSGFAGPSLGGKFMVLERLAATMIPEAGQTSADRTDADVRLGLSYPIYGGWSFAGTSTFQSIADNRNIGINNIARAGALGGISGAFWENLRVLGQVGGVHDRQIGISNSGLQYLTEVQLSPVTSNEYTVWGRASSAQEFLDPRRITTQGTEMNAMLRGPGADLRAHVDLIHNERDFYFADSASMPYTGQAYNIEERMESGLRAGLQGEYLAGESWRVRFDGDLTNRAVTRHDAYKSYDLPGSHIDTRVEERRIAAGSSVSGDLLGAALGASLRYEEYQETHAVVAAPENGALALQQQAAVESQKNSVARRTNLATSLGLPVGAADTVALSASFGILHYDTPDTANTDDRDELDIALHAGYTTRVFPGCTWGVRADLFLHHLVYLFAAQSGNNAWNRIIRLGPFITIAPSRTLRTIASFDVLGNYTVFDFEPLLQSLHSYSFRQLQLRDSTEWDINATIRAAGFVEVRWYEHGQLDYASFRERPIDRVQEWTYGLTLTSAVSRGLRVGAGVRAFTRYVAAYAGAGEYTPTVDLRAFGPTASVMWNAEGWGVLGFDGWYEVIREGSLAARTVPNMHMTVQWTL